MSNEQELGLSEAQEQELQEWFAHTESLVNELIDDGSNQEKMHTIEHHFASSNFEVLEAAAISAFKLGLEVDDPEEAVLENGARVFAFDIITESPLDLDDLLEETQQMYLLAKQCKVEYDGWGTYFEE
ncbi:ribonuclease E inhibitor RraB [Thalassotalea aquiviva]|uniref:ribonuclease E inhibitor RraB n=1 Tax=Thalassotalea aquiviva TaxID=3242415 RepID=UPI00352B0EE3